MEPIERHGERAALRGGGVPGHGAEHQTGDRQGESLKSQREPVTLAILVRQDEQRREEGEQSHPCEPDRAVAGVEQDGQETGLLQALPGARARGHAEPGARGRAPRPRRSLPVRPRRSRRRRRSSSRSRSRPRSPAARAAGRATRTSEAKAPTSETAPAVKSQRTAMAAVSIEAIRRRGGRRAAERARWLRSSRGPGPGRLRLRSLRASWIRGLGRAAGRSGAKNAHAARPTAATAPTIRSHDVQSHTGSRGQHGRAVVGPGQARGEREDGRREPSDGRAPGGAEQDPEGWHRVLGRRRPETPLPGRSRRCWLSSHGFRAPPQTLTSMGPAKRMSPLGARPGVLRGRANRVPPGE